MQLVMLRKTDEFSSVFAFRKRISGVFFAVYYLPSSSRVCRFGFVIAKKTAKLAVERNYMRRVLRELCRTQMNDAMLPSVDMVIQVQKKFGQREFGLVKQEFAMLVHKVENRLSSKVSSRVGNA